MSFTSPIYFVFLIIVILTFYNVPKRYQYIVLLISSTLFYLSFEFNFIYFILFSTLISYSGARLIENTQKWKGWILAFVISLEVIVLFLTKYWNPIAESTHLLNPIHIILPLGISFYTFQSIGYISDVYNQKIKSEKNFLRYSLFLNYFPHLQAGPIETASNFLTQIKRAIPFERKSFLFGLMLLSIGFFKKLVVADNINLYVDIIFNNFQDYEQANIAFATILARFQIYFDFSGYTDIALGTSSLFGIKLMKNFDRPFYSSSISEYWRRWHISLSNWIRNYIFYPLMTTPFSKLGIHFLILFTFVVLGIWHGPSLNFVVYGVIQAALLSLDILTKNMREKFYQISTLNKHPRVLTFFCIVFTFFVLVVPPTLLFKSNDLGHASLLIKSLLSHSQSSLLGFNQLTPYLKQSLMTGVIFIIIVEIIHWFHSKKNLNEIIWERSQQLYIFIIILIFFLIMIFGNFESGSKFIYSEF
jgi:alginate O-acetyltransferase complex protein AlgI